MEKTSYHRNKNSSRKIRKLSSKSHQISDYWRIHLEWKHTRGRVRMVSASRPAWATQTPQLRLHGKIKRVGGGKREGKIGLYNSKILSHYRTREKQECLLHRSTALTSTAGTLQGNRTGGGTPVIARPQLCFLQESDIRELWKAQWTH